MKIYHTEKNTRLEESAQSPQEVQLLRTGSFSHELYGNFLISPEILLNMKKNFDAKIRGVDLAIDYSHDSDKEAAGWITEVFLKENNTQLWAKVNWTPKGKATLEYKEYRYLSSDFSFDYEDNETKQKFGATLLGAGLTNRPFVKEMAPAVALKEITKGDSVTLDELVKANEKLTATVTKLADAVAQMAKPVVPPPAEGTPDPDAVDDEKMLAGMTPEQLMAKIKELQAQLKTMQDAGKADAAKAAEAVKCAERTKKFDILLAEGKAVEAQRDAFLKGDMEKYVSLSEKPNMNPKGVAGGEGEDIQKFDRSETPAQDEVISLSEKLVKDKGAKDIGEAQSMVLRDPKNAELRKKYETEVAI